MNKKLMFEYIESFGIQGVVSPEIIIERFAELDSFIDGFFFALAHENVFDILYPMVQKINQIVIKIQILFDEVIENEYSNVQQYLNNAMTAFLGSRFPDGFYEKEM